MEKEITKEEIAHNIKIHKLPFVATFMFIFSMAFYCILFLALIYYTNCQYICTYFYLLFGEILTSKKWVTGLKASNPVKISIG